MYKVIVNGKEVCTVDADCEVVAMSMARKLGYKHFVDVRRIPSIPGEAEYAKYLDFKTAMANTTFVERKYDTLARIVLGEEDGEQAPKWPLSPEETALAKSYAKFLGQTVYEQFRTDEYNYTRRGR